jgi:hypothetical protein
MPALSDKLPDLGQLNADFQAIVRKRDLLAEQLLEKCAVIGEGVRWARARIEADLRQGAELKQLTQSLLDFKAYGSDVLEVYAALQKELVSWRNGTEALASFVQEAESFVSWLDSLLAKLNRPASPIDEQMLRERARKCDEGNAWVQFDDTQADLYRGDG